MSSRPGLLYICSFQDLSSANPPNENPSRPLHYKNMDGGEKKKSSNLTLLPLSDLGWLVTHDGTQFLNRCMIAASGTTSVTMRAYDLVQRFEGQVEKSERGKFIVAAANTPAAGTDAEFDEWYRKQTFSRSLLLILDSERCTVSKHLDMLSLVRGYCRSTRYRLATDYSQSLNGEDPSESAPRYLALHEFDDAETIDWDMLKMCARTEWSKKVVGGYERMDRDNWLLSDKIGVRKQML